MAEVQETQEQVPANRNYTCLRADRGALAQMDWLSFKAAQQDLHAMRKCKTSSQVQRGKRQQTAPSFDCYWRARYWW